MFARSLQHSLAPIAAACLGIAIFSAMDAIMKGLSIAIGAYNAMLWRTLAGLALTLPLFLVRGGRWPGRRVFLLHLWRGLSAAISILLFFWGLARTPMAQGIALSFISPLVALALAAMFLKERIRGRAIAGSLIAFAGVVVILAGRAQENAGPESMAGAIAILAAAVFYAVNLVVSRRQSLAAGPLEIATFFNIVAVTLYGLGAPWLAAVPDPVYWLPLAGAAFVSIISMMLLAWAYARAEAQYLVSVEYTAFIWATILGWLVFREMPTWATLAGAVLIVAGCIWAARGQAGAGPLPATGPEAAA